jgi:hypothetical protein
VSVFRPSARVSSPDGRIWEIYAYKIRVRDRGRGRTRRVVHIVRLVVRALELGVAAVRSLRSDEWTVEAVTFLPHHESYAWSTTREFKGQVLAQVEGHLARGDLPQYLTNATYLGERPS